MARRKEFLTVLAAAAAALFAACARPNGGGAPAPSDSADLDRFMALSSILTGYASLDADLGAMYLGSIRGNPRRSSALNDLFKQTGFTSGTAPKTLADLQNKGAFDQFSALTMTSEIIEHWYSGNYVDASGKTVSATWTRALAWKACSFTKPPSLCGAPAYWSKLPVA